MRKSKFLHDFINTYCEKLIKEKYIILNNYIDKQLKIEYDLYELNIKEEDHCYL